MINNADELVSAYVDGALEASDRARVESDPELLARVEEFRTIQELMQDVPAIDGDLRERLIETAIGSSATSSKVVSLAPRRRQRARYALIGAVAAGVIALGGIIALNDASDDNETATVSEAPADDGAEDAAATAAAVETAEFQRAGDDTADDDESFADEASAEEAENTTAEAAPQLRAPQLIAFSDRDDLEMALATSDIERSGFSTIGGLDAFDSNAVATLITCTEQLAPEFNGEIDGIARAVITDTSQYLGVPADTEVLIIIAGNAYAVADEATCEVFANEVLFS
jgi:anti-sigma factor RsiW